MNSQDQAHIKILVVTEDPIARETASAVLKEAGYEVHSALEGKDLAGSAKQLKPDLILMDAVETDSVAAENCRCFEADPTLRHIPVILMVTDFHGRALEAALQSGQVDCVRKPLNPMELKWRIDRLVMTRRSTDAPNKAQKYKEILKTAAEVCHKLNQPLQYVMGTVQFLLMDISPEDKLFDRLEMVRQKAELMGDITRKLTTLTRHGAEN